MMQHCATTCALNIGSSGFNFNTKTKGRGGRGNETNHTSFIELPTCCLCGLALLKNSSNMNTEANTEQFLIPILQLIVELRSKNEKQAKKYGSKQTHRQSQWCAP